MEETAIDRRSGSTGPTTANRAAATGAAAAAPDSSGGHSPSPSVASGRRVIEVEAESLRQVACCLDGQFEAAVDTIARIKGRVIVTGMGKSGHIANKIAATFASTGTPAFFVHPGEASHGDLGMIMPDDAVLALSNSGETAELRDLILYTRRFDIPLIAMVGRSPSTLTEAADHSIVVPQIQEACPMGLAPTTSTTCMLALGDALAVALLERSGFTASKFADFHPGGKLGSQLTRVDQLMRKQAELPLVPRGCEMKHALVEMTRKCLGCVGIVDDDQRLCGIITDGDLRRHMNDDLFTFDVDSIMTGTPMTIDGKALAVEALAMLNERSISVLFIVEDGRPVGALHIHDCLRAGIA